MSRATKELASYERAMSEVDGEFCIPHKENEARYYIDLGPILGQVRSAWARPGIQNELTISAPRGGRPQR